MRPPLRLSRVLKVRTVVVVVVVVVVIVVVIDGHDIDKTTLVVIKSTKAK